MSARKITNHEDIIDSRDIIARIKELKNLDDRDEDKQRELDTLKALAEKCNYGDWEFGTILIRDSYFGTYARDLAVDNGAIQSGAPWPVYCIDWERAARELQAKYKCVDFDGVMYWIQK